MKHLKQSVIPQGAKTENLDKPKRKKKKTRAEKKRKKKEKWKYDIENTGGPYFFNSQEFLARQDGEYAGYSIGEIWTRVGKRLSEKRRAGEKMEYLEVVHQVLDELGYFEEKWKRKAILSALSKEMWRRRKARIAEVERKKIEEAHLAEINHSLPFEID